MTTTVTRSDIRRGLADLGLRAGDRVAVHSSLRSFGHVDGGAMAVVDAVLDAVGERGLVMMPALADTVDAHGDLLPLDAATAPITTGAIPAAMTRHPAAHRGLHPLYSIVFAGSNAAAWARENERLMFPYGAEQQYALLLGDVARTPVRFPGSGAGHILQLGVDDRTNSTIHILEELCDPVYLREKKSQAHLAVAGFFAMPLADRRTSLAHHRAGPRRDFARVTPLVDAAGLARRVRIGSARCTLQPALGLKRIFDAAMAKDPEFMVVRAR